MAISLVAHTIQNANNPTTSAIDTTGASLIIVGVSSFTGAANTPTDNKGNTWHALTTQSGATTNGEQMYYAWNPSVGAGHTFTGNTNIYGIIVAAFSGVQTSSDPLDVQNGTSGTSQANSNIQTGSITPGSNNELVISYLGNEGPNAATFTIDSSMTIMDQASFNGGVNYGQAMAYIVQTTAGSINPTWTFSLSGQNGGATIASFKAGSGGGTAVAAVLPLMGVGN